jgi:hypothetical protein
MTALFLPRTIFPRSATAVFACVSTMTANVAGMLAMTTILAVLLPCHEAFSPQINVFSRKLGTVGTCNKRPSFFFSLRAESKATPHDAPPLPSSIVVDRKKMIALGGGLGLSTLLQLLSSDQAQAAETGKPKGTVLVVCA